MPVSSVHMPGRVALLTPFAAPSVRGNAVTVERVARGLARRGIELRVWDLAVTPDAQVEAEVAEFRPSLVHAFHAYRVGPLAVRLARRAEVPLVVTLTGTDANHDLFDPERAAAVRRVLEAAARLTVFHATVGERVTQALPDLGNRVVTVPQAVALARGEPFDLESRVTLPRPAVVFLFPAGIRMVKRPRFPLAPLDRLTARDPSIRLLYAGPVLDLGEGEALREALAGRPWAQHLGALPHEQMASLLGRADVVVNCSISEGGMANSVLEALSMERAVLASDIAGNRSLVAHGETGLLFSDEASFAAGAARLAADAGLRRRLGRAGRAQVERVYPPAREIDGYLAVYSALGVAPSVDAAGKPAR